MIFFNEGYKRRWQSCKSAVISLLSGPPAPRLVWDTVQQPLGPASNYRLLCFLCATNLVDITPNAMPIIVDKKKTIFSSMVTLLEQGSSKSTPVAKSSPVKLGRGLEGVSSDLIKRIREREQVTASCLSVAHSTCSPTDLCCDRSERWLRFCPGRLS